MESQKYVLLIGRCSPRKKLSWISCVFVVDGDLDQAGFEIFGLSHHYFFITKHISTGPMDSSPVDPPPLMQHCPSSSSSDSVLTTSSISSDKENIHPVQRQPPEPQSPDIP